MLDNLTINVENLSKVYKLYNSHMDRMKEALHPLRKKFHHDFHALSDVSFKIRKGESVGIIGRNGSGKSTLLKILSGVLTPTIGRVTVNGRVSALLELGAGFNPELTGVENVYFNGMIMGHSREAMDEKLDDILTFADIGEFVYHPVKTYSSGMFVRLAFAVATSVDPEILIIDEALSVGDAHFQQKCMNRVKLFKEAGGSIVFVSHDLNAVKVVCDRAIFLHQGEVIEDSDPETVIQAYNYMLAKMSRGEEIRLVKRNEQTSFGNLKIEIKKIELQNETGLDTRIFVAGEKAKIRLTLNANADADSVVVGILVRDRLGQDIFGTNSYFLNQIISANAGEHWVFEYEMQLNIGPGIYTVSPAVHKDMTHVSECFHWYDAMLNFEVVQSSDFYFIGLAKLYPALHITKTG